MHIRVQLSAEQIDLHGLIPWRRRQGLTYRPILEATLIATVVVPSLTERTHKKMKRDTSLCDQHYRETDYEELSGSFLQTDNNFLQT